MTNGRHSTDTSRFQCQSRRPRLIFTFPTPSTVPLQWPTIAPGCPRINDGTQTGSGRGPHMNREALTCAAPPTPVDLMAPRGANLPVSQSGGEAMRRVQSASQPTWQPGNLLRRARLAVPFVLDWQTASVACE